MLAKFFVLFFTVSMYYCFYHNNQRSDYKIEIPRKYIKLIFPLLNNGNRSEVDIFFFLEAAYLILSCIIYYIITILGLLSFVIATIIWVALFFGITFILLGGIFIRNSDESSSILNLIILWIEGIIFILIGLFIIIVTVIGRYDLLIKYLS